MSSFTARWCSAARPRSTRDVARRAPVAVRQSMAPKWAAPPLPGHSYLYSPRLWAGATPSPASGSCFSPPGLRNSESVVRPPCALPTYLDPSAAEPFLAFNTLVLIPWCLMVSRVSWLGTAHALPCTDTLRSGIAVLNCAAPPHCGRSLPRAGS